MKSYGSGGVKRNRARPNGRGRNRAGSVGCQLDWVGRWRGSSCDDPNCAETPPARNSLCGNTYRRKKLHSPRPTISNVLSFPIKSVVWKYLPREILFSKNTSRGELWRRGWVGVGVCVGIKRKRTGSRGAGHTLTSSRRLGWSRAERNQSNSA